jgi:hypothetical protein
VWSTRASVTLHTKVWLFEQAPVVASQESLVHELPSSQVFAGWVQVAVVPHWSSVHQLVSGLHAVPGPLTDVGEQTPAEQMSPVVHGLPSSQEWPPGPHCTHLFRPSSAQSVQQKELTTHWSFLTHVLPTASLAKQKSSSRLVGVEFRSQNCPGWQLASDPRQLAQAPCWQKPEEQSLGCTQHPLIAACWHSALVPLQASVVQTFASAAHAVPVAFSPLGHAAEFPVQTVVVSQSPADVWQVAPALPAGCWQEAVVPLHVSIVQAFPSSVHAVPFALSPLGHAVELPEQVFAVSHSPPEEWHVAPELPAGCWHAVLVPLHASVVQTLPSGGQNVPEGAAVIVPSSQNPAPEWPDPGAGPQRVPTAQGLPLSQIWVPLVPHCVQFPPPQYHPTAHCWFRAQAVLVNRAVQAPAPVLSFRLQVLRGAPNGTGAAFPLHVPWHWAGRTGATSGAGSA